VGSHAMQPYDMVDRCALAGRASWARVRGYVGGGDLVVVAACSRGGVSAGLGIVLEPLSSMRKGERMYGTWGG
jgi:hypothetical protein